jgi:hypothetical protein
MDHCHLAFVSACGSSTPTILHGLHEPISVSSAFVLAGARSVVGALWPIRDVAGLAYADAFYHRLVQAPGSEIHELASHARERLREFSSGDASGLVSRVNSLRLTSADRAVASEMLDEVTSPRPFETRIDFAAFSAISTLPDFCPFTEA